MTLSSVSCTKFQSLKATKFDKFEYGFPKQQRKHLCCSSQKRFEEEHYKEIFNNYIVFKILYKNSILKESSAYS